MTTPTKCECQHCHGHIEFDRADFEEMGTSPDRVLGQVIACPHCELDTTLYLKRAGTPFPFAAPKPKPAGRRKRWLIPALAVVIVVAIVALVIWAARAAARESGSELLAAFFSTVAGFIGLALFGLVLILVILWIIFPVFVYFGIERIETLLKQIERNTRKEDSRPSIPIPRPELAGPDIRPPGDDLRSDVGPL